MFDWIPNTRLNQLLYLQQERIVLIRFIRGSRNVLKLTRNTEEHLRPRQTSMIELFCENI